MTRWADEFVDSFLADVPEEDGDHLARALEPPELSPSAALRDALMATVKTQGRFDRFAAVVGELLDVSPQRAQELLDGIAKPDVWVSGIGPGISLYHVVGGPKVEGYVTGFVRLPQNTIFPEHRHLGDESVLVIQGSFVDGVTGAIHRPGEIVELPANSAHDFRARPGPTLVYLVVLAEGVQIGDRIMTADDPEL